MKIRNAVLATFLAITAAYYANAQTPASQRWSPATYHDLTIGTSTRSDVLRLLGKPKAVGKEPDTGLPTMTYAVSDPVPGMLTIYTQKGILDGMTLSPKKPLTKNDIIRLFGSDFTIVRYATDDCLTEGGSAPIYEAPNGPIKHMEYRDRGVAAVFNGAEVVAVVFVSKPIGPTHSLCTERGKKK